MLTTTEGLLALEIDRSKSCADMDCSLNRSVSTGASSDSSLKNKLEDYIFLQTDKSDHPADQN